MKKTKKGIAMPFNWIFAIIAGVVILFLALYGVSRFIRTSESISYTETGAKLVAFFESVGGTGSEKVEINFREDVEIFFGCDELNNRPFGLQRVGFGNTGKKIKGNEVSIKDRYIFSENIIEGKNLHIFSKPFYLGYKVGDLTMISSEDYCFVDSPLIVNEELSGLELSNVEFVDNFGKCSEKSIKVCFNRDDCDVEVSSNDNFKSGKVVKDGVEMFYVGNLIFAGIFSSPEIHECNVKRLIGRFKELALIYREKIKIIEIKGCNSNIDERLNGVLAMKLDSSSDLILIERRINEIDVLNKGQPEGCGVW